MVKKNSSSKLGWGILSTAWIAEYLVQPLKLAGRSKLIAIASRTEATAHQFAVEHGVPKTYGSYESMLEDPDIDVVYIPLPNSLHCEWSLKAARAGKHVLCEKPLVQSLSEMDDMENAAVTNNVIIFEAFAHLHHPQTQVIQKRIDDGVLGSLHSFLGWDAFFLQPGSKSNFRYYRKYGGGSLWDIGVYPVSLAIVLNRMGPPLEVWGQLGHNGTEVDMWYSGQMRFSNGVVAQISSSFCTTQRSELHIVGEQGVFEVKSPGTPEGTGHLDTYIVFVAPNGSTENICVPAYDAYQAEVEAMEACVLDGVPPMVPLSLSRDILRTILALYDSAQSGNVVQL
ncbi:MAG: Gfo/Idh/MocA family oxidoreductase [Anaerolineales bacterium]|nr:Gfo/Idh/MocA family oxidoreductase [Anaerolineales bacterium]